jgi:hypothetical protein
MLCESLSSFWAVLRGVAEKDAAYDEHELSRGHDHAPVPALSLERV